MTPRFLQQMLHAHSLTDMQFNGDDPRSARMLTEPDAAVIRDSLEATERVDGYVTGRVLGEVGGAWCVTSHGLLLLGATRFDPVIRVPYAQVSLAECERGKYGFTLRLHTTDARFTLHGCSPLLAIAAYRLLAARVPAAPAVGARALSTEEALRAIQCFADAAVRTQALTLAGSLAARASQALEMGVIDADEHRAVEACLQAA